MRVKGLLLFNHIYPRFFMSMAYRVNNMVDAHLTKNATKPYWDYPQWIKPPCLLSLKPPETELYGDQIADSYFSELLCSCYFQRLMSQSYKFTRVNVQTVYSFPALPLLYVWWMLLPKTLRWPKEDETLLKKLKLLSSLQFLPPHWFTELLHVDLWSSFPSYVYGRLYLIYYHRFHSIALPTFTINFISWTAAAFVTSLI